LSCYMCHLSSRKKILARFFGETEISKKKLAATTIE
jgi:hypothetical protein